MGGGIAPPLLLHLEVDVAQQTMKQLRAVSAAWTSSLDTTRRLAGHLMQVWNGPAAEEFLYRLRAWHRTMEALATELKTLVSLGEREIEEWIAADARLELGSLSPPPPVVGPYPGPEQNKNFWEVIDPVDKTRSEPEDGQRDTEKGTGTVSTNQRDDDQKQNTSSQSPPPEDSGNGGKEEEIGGQKNGNNGENTTDSSREDSQKPTQDKDDGEENQQDENLNEPSPQTVSPPPDENGNEKLDDDSGGGRQVRRAGPPPRGGTGTGPAGGGGGPSISQALDSSAASGEGGTAGLGEAGTTESLPTEVQEAVEQPAGPETIPANQESTPDQPGTQTAERGPAWWWVAAGAAGVGGLGYLVYRMTRSADPEMSPAMASAPGIPDEDPTPIWPDAPEEFITLDLQAQDIGRAEIGQRIDAREPQDAHESITIADDFYQMVYDAPVPEGAEAVSLEASSSGER